MRAVRVPSLASTLFAGAALCAIGSLASAWESGCVADLKTLASGDIDLALRIEAWALPLNVAAFVLACAGLLRLRSGGLSEVWFAFGLAVAVLAVPTLMLCGMQLAVEASAWCR